MAQTIMCLLTVVRGNNVINNHLTFGNSTMRGCAWPSLAANAATVAYNVSAKQDTHYFLRSEEVFQHAAYLNITFLL